MPNLSELLSRPRVVATVHRPEDLDTIAAGSVSPETCDILEFRLDSLRDHLDAAETAMKATNFPVLITARHPDEGGEGHLDSATRGDLLSRFLPLATLVDVEARSMDELSQVASEVKDQQRGLVVSAHDFEKPFTTEQFEAVGGTTAREGGTLAKMAMVLSQPDELAQLFSYVDGYTRAGTRVSAMGMGPLGKLSRLALAAAGSCLNYGYLSEPNAPGQWSAAELKRLLGEVLPSE